MITRYGLPLLAIISFSFAILQMTKAQQKPPSARPPVDPGTSPFGLTVAAAGIVEPQTENISIGTHLPGVVSAVHIQVDDTIKAGTCLFELDDRQLQAELVARQAMLENAEAQPRRLAMMPREEEKPPLMAKLAEARATRDDRLTMYERVRSVPAISIEEVSNRKAAADVALAQYEKASADLKLMEAGAWKYEKDVALAAIAQAKAQVQQTQTELNRLKVLAPRVRKPGTERTVEPIPDSALVEFKVLQVNVRPGESVGTSSGQPLVVLGTVGKVNVRVDIDENDIGRFKLGMKGIANPRGNPGARYPISFVRVEPYVIPKRSLTGGNTERVDTRVLQVIYSLDNANAPLYVGQQLDVFLSAE